LRPALADLHKNLPNDLCKWAKNCIDSG